MPRTKQRTPELKGHVLHVALATLAADGPAGFTTRKVADGAGTSIPAVYELFGAKAGLVREVFFEGFRLMRRRFDELPDSADIVDVIAAIRRFAKENPNLAAVMFSRPFADFDPGPDEAEAGAACRQFIMERVRRCGLQTDVADAAHVILAVTQGLAAQETAGWLGTSKASIERRWRLAVAAVLDGLAAQTP